MLPQKHNVNSNTPKLVRLLPPHPNIQASSIINVNGSGTTKHHTPGGEKSFCPKKNNPVSLLICKR